MLVVLPHKFPHRRKLLRPRAPLPPPAKLLTWQKKPPWWPPWRRLQGLLVVLVVQAPVLREEEEERPVKLPWRCARASVGPTRGQA